MNLEKRNSPSYLAKYGLSRAPFSTTIEHDMFYTESSRAQKLDILLHLSQYSHDILLVIGPEGSGKTTLLNQFSHKAEKTWKICQVDAHPLIDEEQLILRISHGFNLQVEHFDIDHAEQDLVNQLQTLLEKHDCVIIVVDNAQILSKNVLALLCRLATVKNEQNDISVRLILFSQSAIRPTISQLDITYRIFDLPPFDELATKELIHHRMTIAGAKDEAVFSDHNINKIHKLSNGIPSNILDLGHKILTEAPPIQRKTYKGEAQTFEPQKQNQKQQKRKSKILPISGMLLLFSLAAVILGFQDDINRMFFFSKESDDLPTKLQLPQESPPISDTHKEDLGEKKTVVALKIPELEKDTPQDPDSQARVLDSQQPLADERKIASTNNPAEIEQKQNSAITPIVEPKPQAAIKPAPKPKLKPKPKPKPKPKAKTQEPDKTSKDFKSEIWILKQNPKHRSLQLIAGYNYATLTNYVEKFRIPKDKLAYYRSQNKGKIWHSLLYGIYPDYQAANSAAKTLGKKLGTNKPWIRKLKSIQNDIKNQAKP